MKAWSVLLLGAVSCSPPAGTGSGPTASSPAPTERSAGVPADEVASDGGEVEPEKAPDAAPAETPPQPPGVRSEPQSEPRIEGAAAPTLVAMCEGLCVERNRMRAVAAEVIDAQCREDCEGIDGRPVEADCARAASESRDALEARPMKERARWFFTLLDDSALSCGAVDPVISGLASAGQRSDLERRDTALRTRILADPWLSLTCPAGASALAPAFEGSVDAVVELCPIAGASPGQPIHRDLDVSTFLAVEVIRTHWRALGATSHDHEIMLKTVLLSTALGNE